MVYKPGQFKHIIPYIPRTPKWLLLGGPASGNEAQCALEQWPDMQIIGVEPYPDALEWQLDNGWPVKHLLLPYALWDSVGTQMLTEPSGPLRLCQARVATKSEVDESGRRSVKTITLDCLDAEYGPFEDAVLWIDIEGSEYRALCGARGLLERGAIIAMNVEMDLRQPELNANIYGLLTDYGYKQIHESTLGNEHYRDRIFTKG